MRRFYRIYLGARNTAHAKFTPHDHDVLNAVLNRYFRGWTKVKAEGSWEGKTEESAIITVSTDKDAETAKAGKTPIKSCASQLKQHFGQEAVIIEDAGETILF